MSAAPPLSGVRESIPEVLRTRRHRIKRFLIGLLVIPLASAVGLEVGARLIDRLRGEPWNSEARREVVERFCRMLTRISYKPNQGSDAEEVRRLSQQILLSPYTGWEEKITQEEIAADESYYGRQESRENWDVLVLGGSVAYFLADQGGDRLRHRMATDPRFESREIRVHNFAIRGYKQPQQAMLLAYLFSLGHAPDVVIEIDGFNEAALAWANAQRGVHPVYPSQPHWVNMTRSFGGDRVTVDRLCAVRASQDRARELNEWYLRSGWWRSCFLDHATGLWVENARRDYQRAYRGLIAHLESQPPMPEVRGPPFRDDEESILAAMVTSWEEGSVSLHGLCTVRGIPYFHFLQPTLHDQGSKSLTRKEIDISAADRLWIEGVKRLYGRLRESGGRLKERGIDFVDATGAFREHPEDVYVDVCHVGKNGNEILADAIADALLGTLPR